MDRGDLTNAEWELVGPLLPPERGRWARPAQDNRRFLNGMIHVLRVGCPWRYMHERLGLPRRRPGASGTRSTPASDCGPSKVCGTLC